MKIGILGAGQLGQMLGLAGIPLGHTFSFFDPSTQSPAASLGPVVEGNFTDAEAIARFASSVDVLSYEFENIPAKALAGIGQDSKLKPSRNVLAVSQDRLQEKQMFIELGVPTTNFIEINSFNQLEKEIGVIGLPAVLKTRRLGYDGKGQAVIRSISELKAAWEQLGSSELLLENFVRFDREISILGVRSQNGECKTYPLVENYHRAGILRRSIAPAAGLSHQLEDSARNYSLRLMEHFKFEGVLTIEFFVSSEDSTLIANEIAPRVHNSGHWSIEGAYCSQFENHIRAISGAPLGDCRVRGSAVMYNLIGKIPDTSALLKIPGLALHLYGKTERPGRKLGHVTLIEENSEKRIHAMREIERMLGF